MINTLQQNAGHVEIVYYTDPLCCWSWAFEPQWRRLQYELGDKVSSRYCMGGLIADWNVYNDSVNCISRPFQMGPLWTEARHVSGMPFHDRIWLSDPPSTSYPACVAVKCAGLQSNYAEDRYLRRTREAVMIEGLNIARQTVLFDIAKKLEAENTGFDSSRFIKDFECGAGTEAFKSDLQEVRYKSINRFPTLIISGADKRKVMITGYRPYPILLNVLKEITGLSCAANTINIEEYKNYFGSITNREAEEALNVYHDER